MTAICRFSGAVADRSPTGIDEQTESKDQLLLVRYALSRVVRLPKREDWGVISTRAKSVCVLIYQVDAVCLGVGRRRCCCTTASSPSSVRWRCEFKVLHCLHFKIVVDTTHARYQNKSNRCLMLRCLGRLDATELETDGIGTGATVFAKRHLIGSLQAMIRQTPVAKSGKTSGTSGILLFRCSTNGQIEHL